MSKGVNTFSADHAPSARIQLVTPEVDGTRRSVPCLFQGFEGKRLTLQASEPLPISSAVSVEFNDALFLGEVVASNSVENQGFDIEIKVEQVLSGLQNLMALRARLLGEGVPQASSLVPVQK